MKKLPLIPVQRSSRNVARALALAVLSAAAMQWTACGGSSKGTSADAAAGDAASDVALGRGGAAGGKSGGSATGGVVGGGGISGGGISGGGGVTGGGGVIGGGGTAGGATGSAKTQCNDGLDNDGDGKIDLVDPECVSALDDDESSFATGIPGDNVDACKQDCFFDGNSGMGDDHCEWALQCDPSNVGATAVKKCEYDPNAKNCPTSQPKTCIDHCRPLTPNGCDCFGCCQVNSTTGVHTVRLSATCTAAKFDDPTACSPCTQTTTCINDCKPCELCLGKTTLPPECHGGGGAGGSGAGGSAGIECPDSVPCGTDQSICDKTDTLCVSGCCVPHQL